MANLEEETPSSPLAPISSNTNTLQLSGSTHGDTIQIEGGTGSLRFSLQFNIHNKYKHKHVSENHFNLMSANSFENNHIFKNTSPSSSYITPNDNIRQVLEMGRQNEQAELSVENNGIADIGESNTGNRVDVLTRLKSGAISPVKYFPRISAMSRDKLRTENKMKCVRKRGLLQTVLRRHSLPVRPCSSYAFFVMSNWDSVKNSSFSIASKTLGQMWCQISQREKKAFVDMALKDSARYKRQCALLQGTRKRIR